MADLGPMFTAPPAPMTHTELVERARRWLEGTRRCALVATERSCFKSDESPDAIGWDAYGRSVLVECKVSMSDLYADRRKRHRRETAGMGLERWYMAEDGVLRPDALGDGWGLLVIRRGRVFRAVAPIVRHEKRGEIAQLEAPLLVALTRRAMWGNRNGLSADAPPAEVESPTPPPREGR